MSITGSNNIFAALAGRLKKSGGFRWMYLSDYEKIQ